MRYATSVTTKQLEAALRSVERRRKIAEARHALAVSVIEQRRAEVMREARANGMTLQQIADAAGLKSRERVRQIVKESQTST